MAHRNHNKIKQRDGQKSIFLIIFLGRKAIRTPDSADWISMWMLDGTMFLAVIVQTQFLFCYFVPRVVVDTR